MKKIILLMVLVSFFSCTKESKPKEISTIIGNTYIAKDRTIDYRPLFIIYEFTEAGKINIEERLDSETGVLYDEGHGYFEYNHPGLKLKIQSVPNCESDGCFNNFTASVNDDKKSFTYQIFDITVMSSRDLVFRIKQ